MAKGKAIIAFYRCTECRTPVKVTRHGKKALRELRRFCAKCRKHTVIKAKDIKKPAK